MGPGQGDPNRDENGAANARGGRHGDENWIAEEREDRVDLGLW